ncbi:MAG: hypothetical protein H7123_05005 [Thermoleophilia bacterium]|nr:hypothetical protein [Thermoleophilia bacterium]
MTVPDSPIEPCDSVGAVFSSAYGAHRSDVLAATEPRNRDGFISPSQSLGCVTAAIHQLNGEARETTHTTELADLFDVANGIHDRIQEVGVEMGMLTDCEAFVEIPEWRVKGQIDGIIVTRDETGRARRALLEIKTLPEWLFNKVAEAGKPLAGNLTQAMLYLRATGLEEVHFLYVERSYLRRLELVQPLDHGVLARVEEWIQGVLAHHAGGTYPAAEEVWRPSGRCSQCVYVRTCRTRLYGPADPTTTAGAPPGTPA